MKKRESKDSPVNELVKKVLIIKGNKTSETINSILKDLTLLFKPNCKALTRKNEIFPFEDANSLEFLCGKNDCSMFVLGSHSKKRPDNLIIGRLYDGHILDMFELGISNFQSIEDFHSSKKTMGSKPLLVFSGDQWRNDSMFSMLQNVLIDLFRGDKIEKLSMQGVDHVIAFSLVEGKVHIRTHTLSFKKAESKIPEVSLNPMGPFMDMTLRRHQKASEDMWKASLQKSKIGKPKKVKNITQSSLVGKLGRIHMTPQNLDKMGGKRVRALRSFKKNSDATKSDDDVVTKKRRTS